MQNRTRSRTALRKTLLSHVGHLSGGYQADVYPVFRFHLIPLHAMFRQENGTRKYLLDDYLVTYAPSAKMLRLCLNKAHFQQHEGCIAWANPKQDLPFARREAEAVASSCDWKILPAATRNDIIKEGHTAGVIHYSGHADGNALILHNTGVVDGEDRLKAPGTSSRVLTCQQPRSLLSAPATPGKSIQA